MEQKTEEVKVWDGSKEMASRLSFIDDEDYVKKNAIKSDKEFAFLVKRMAEEGHLNDLMSEIKKIDPRQFRRLRFKRQKAINEQVSFKTRPSARNKSALPVENSFDETNSFSTERRADRISSVDHGKSMNKGYTNTRREGINYHFLPKVRRHSEVAKEKLAAAGQKVASQNKPQQKTLATIGTSGDEDLDLQLRENPQFITYFHHISGAKDDKVRSMKISKTSFRNHLLKRYPPEMVSKILHFLEIPAVFDIATYERVMTKILKSNISEMIYFTFMCYDFNSDHLICRRDIFNLMKSKSILLEKEAVLLTQAIKRLPKMDIPANFYKIYQVESDPSVLANFLTHTQLKRRELETKQPHIKSDVKKDTCYHLAFLSIDHSPERRMEKAEKERRESETKRRKTHLSSKRGEKEDKFHEETQFLTLSKFSEIFISDPPELYYDFLAYTCLFFFPNRVYPFQAKDLLKLYE